MSFSARFPLAAKFIQSICSFGNGKENKKERTDALFFKTSQAQGEIQSNRGTVAPRGHDPNTNFMTDFGIWKQLHLIQGDALYDVSNRLNSTDFNTL